MKYIYSINELKEFNDRKDELVELINNYLAYLKDDNIDITITRLNFNRDKKNGFKLNVEKNKNKKYINLDEEDVNMNDFYYKWEDIKDYFISFCELLVQKSFIVNDSLFFDVNDDDDRKECLTFSYDDIINDRIGDDVILYSIYLFVEY